MFLNPILYPYKLYKLGKSQRKSPYELEKLQEKRLKNLIQHAYNKVNYYRKLFDRTGIKPEHIKTIQDLVRIPITTRKELQALPKREIIARDIDLSRCFDLHSSGSTGIPLVIFLGIREIISRGLFYRRMFSENGCRFMDKNKTMIITNPQHFRISKIWFNYLGILQEKYISTLEEPQKQLKVILEFKPQIIRGVASSLKNLAIEIQKKRIKGINPRLIFSTAELMSKQDREFITSIFKAELFDYYSCHECGIIAWECKEHLGHHIDIENVIVEFIKEDGTYAKTGEEGEVVITSLDSYTMPFIRYKIGDIGVPSDERCPCGRTLPLIKRILGRSNDYFILPNGKKVYFYFLRQALRDIMEVGQFQMIQQRKDKVRINIVKNDDFSLKTIVKIKENCKVILGNDVELAINIVEKINNSGCGKLQDIKSELQ